MTRLIQYRDIIGRNDANARLPDELRVFAYCTAAFESSTRPHVGYGGIKNFRRPPQSRTHVAARYNVKRIGVLTSAL